MNLKQIEAFVMIANNGSFSRTAKEMYLTQPTVSAYINSLESELGVKLLMRTTKEVNLTEQGSVVYLYAKELLEVSDKINEICGNQKEKAVSSQILISSSSLPAQYLLATILASYSRTYPHIQFIVNESDSEHVIADLENHKANIGFTGTKIPRKNIKYIPFYKDELVVITPNTDWFRILKKHPKPLKEWIRNQPLIMRESGSGTRQETFKALEGLDVNTDNLNIIATFANTGAILMSVKEAVGCAIVSKLAATAAIESGDVLEFPLSDEGFYRNIYMVVNTIQPTNENTSKLMSIAKKCFKSSMT